MAGAPGRGFASALALLALFLLPALPAAFAPVQAPSEGAATAPGAPIPGPTAGPRAHALLGALAAQVPVADTIQPGDRVLEVRLADGSVLVGRIVATTAEAITVETVGGARVELRRAQVRDIREARGQVVNGRFWPADPNRTRLFFSSTARPLDRGEGYVASYMLFFPFVAYGITDRFSIAGGTPIFPGSIGEVFYLAPKYTLMRRPGMDLAVGSLAFFFTVDVDEGSAGLLYGVGTFGNPNQAVSAGAGWGFALSRDESRIGGDPVIMLGGEYRVGEHVKVVTENWLVPASGSVGLLTGGVRLFGARLSGDLGFGVGVDDGDAWCCLPVVNVVYNFGGRR